MAVGDADAPRPAPERSAEPDETRGPQARRGPDGGDRVKIEGTFDIAAPRDAVYRHITDPGLMARCVPGCESIEQLSATGYRTKVMISVGGIKARFNLVVEVTQEQAPSLVISQTRGEEGSRASVLAADNQLTLVEIDPLTTRVSYASEVSVTGRLGKFALGVMKKKVEAMGQEFAARLREFIQAQTPPLPGVAVAQTPVEPVSPATQATPPGIPS
jgi:uncharacterized protein